MLLGEAPGIEAFAARYPEHVGLAARLRELERLRGELGRLLGESELPPAPVVAGFSILQAVARGGMGTVYAAMQERPRRLCAIKVINHYLPLAEARFAREADLAGRLSHPAIATVYT